MPMPIGSGFVATAASDLRVDGDHLAQLAADVLSASPFPALVLEVPSEKIVATSSAASLLLEPTGRGVVGQNLEHFTADHPSSGSELFAGGRLNGFEAFRVLRRPGGTDLKIRMWIRTFDHQPPSDLVLAVIVPEGGAFGGPRPADWPEHPAVVGTLDPQSLIERISSDAQSLFGWPLDELVGRPFAELIAEPDVQNYAAALNDASTTQNGVSLYLDVRTVDSAASDPPSTLGCEMLILPLSPSPSCAFVLLPTPVELSRTLVAGGLSAILGRLGRGAEVAQLVRGAAGGLTERDIPGLNRLTTRELEVLARLLDGQRAPAIATELFLTQSTVRNHLGAIFGKVGVSSQHELLSVFRAATSGRVDR
jgi:DNA-binding CsgD family transcriptional regulator